MSLMLSALLAASVTWQTGVWRDVQKETHAPVFWTIGGGFTVPLSTDEEVFTIEYESMRYVVKWRQGVHLKGIIINDPVQFRMDGDEKMIVRLDGKDKTLIIVKRERLNP